MINKTVVLLLIVITSLRADFCAVRLDIRNERAEPVMGGQVLVRDAAGSVVMRQSIERGAADICNLQFGLHTVSVSTNSAYTVDIVGVRIAPDREQTLTIVLNSRPRLIGQAGNACVIYLRTVDSRGRAVPNLAISRSSGAELISSIHGFASALLGVGQIETFRVSGTAEPQHVSLKCDQLDIKEVTFRMKSVP